MISMWSSGIITGSTFVKLDIFMTHTDNGRKFIANLIRFSALARRKKKNESNWVDNVQCDSKKEFAD